MRERITIVHPPNTGIDPDALVLDGSGLAAPSLEAVREDRLTVALGDLPSEFVQVLGGFRRVQVRWAAQHAYKTLDPFTSRLSPGLHVSYTPSQASNDASKLCSVLQAFGPLNCMSQEAFTTMNHPSTASESATYYFYQMLKDINDLSKSIDDLFCQGDESCQSRARQVGSAASVDFTFDSDTKVLKFSALWALGDQPVSVSASSSRRIEAGILSKGSPPNMGQHDIGMGGILVVLGETKSPSPTLFMFPSRHRASGSHFSSRFLTPTGLHPTLQIHLSDNQLPTEADECRLYTYLTLPKAIFADRYQLEDKLFLASKNLTEARNLSLPVDLEAPSYTTESWGSTVLLEMAPPTPNKLQTWTAEVPLHLRYLEPSETGVQDIEIPYPVVFWACPSDDAPRLNNNPFDRSGLGYDELFSSDTIFWHAEPRPEAGGDDVVLRVTVPVMGTSATSWVGLGTGLVVTLGFAWTLWKLATAYLQYGYGNVTAEEDTKPEGDKRKPM